MRLKYEFIVTEIGDDLVAVPTGEGAEQFHGTIRLNEYAAEVFGLLCEDTTPEAIHLEMQRRYPDTDRDEIGNALAEFFTVLSREGLLIQP